MSTANGKYGPPRHQRGAGARTTLEEGLIMQEIGKFERPISARRVRRQRIKYCAKLREKSHPSRWYMPQRGFADAPHELVSLRRTILHRRLSPGDPWRLTLYSGIHHLLLYQHTFIAMRYRMHGAHTVLPVHVLSARLVFTPSLDVHL